MKTPILNDFKKTKTSGKVQNLKNLEVVTAVTGKGWQSRRKASKLKPEHRAYTKVGCHHPPPPPPTTTQSLFSLN